MPSSTERETVYVGRFDPRFCNTPNPGPSVHRRCVLPRDHAGAHEDRNGSRYAAPRILQPKWENNDG